MTTAREQLMEALDAYQTEVGHWAVKNFDDNAGWGSQGPMMGIVEGVGELHHARLKSHQRIREGARKPLGQEEDKTDEEVDALGDILVYMLDYCHRRGLKLSECFLTAWEYQQ